MAAVIKSRKNEWLAKSLNTRLTFLCNVAGEFPSGPHVEIAIPSEHGWVKVFLSVNEIKQLSDFVVQCEDRSV